MASPSSSRVTLGSVPSPWISGRSSGWLILLKHNDVVPLRSRCFKAGEETEVQNKAWVPANVSSLQWSFF